MPFTGATYVNVAGATTAVAGQTVQSAVWDNIHNDIGTSLTMLMSQLVATPTNRNILWMNGGFEIWQRGAGASASITQAASITAYTADRWYLITGANQASVVAAVTGLTNQSQLAAKITRNNAQTGITAMTFGYPLDTDEVYRMRGKNVSLSFTVQAGANWSPASGTLTVALYVGTGAVAKRGGGFTGETTVLSIATNLTPSGAAVAVSGNSSGIVPLTSTQAELQFTWTPVGTAGAADSFTVDDIQLEVQNSASTWTPSLFDRLPFDSMLIGCKRHYQKTFDYSTAPAQGAGLQNSIGNICFNTTFQGVDWDYEISCRVTASITTYNPSGASANWQNVTGGTSLTVIVDTNNIGSNRVLIYSGGTVAAVSLVYIHAAASASI